MVFQVLLFIIGFGSVLFLTYIVTRYIGEKAKGAMTGKYINVIDTVPLGIDKKLHLIKVGQQFILIASGGKTIEFLANINLEEYEEDKEKTGIGGFDFKRLFDKYLQTYRGKKEKKDGQHFKSNLEKLKEINHEISQYVRNDNNDKTKENGKSNK